jgi:hypothetical protein
MVTGPTCVYCISQNGKLLLLTPAGSELHSILAAIHVHTCVSRNLSQGAEDQARDSQVRPDRVDGFS